MGTLRPGQAGLVNGKVGELVVSKWKKKIVTRSAPGKATKPGSALQLDQRLRFSLVSSFIARVAGAINVGFQSCNPKMTPVNAAIRFHLDKLILGSYPDYVIDYTKVKLTIPNSLNRLADGLKVTIAIEDAALLRISWIKDYRPNYLTKSTDQAYLLCYNAGTDKSYFFNRIAIRADITTKLALPDSFKNNQVHGYLFFVSANGKLVSNTHYLGMIES